MVYGLENKNGLYFNFAKNTFTIWSHQCQLPTEELADDLYLGLMDVHDFTDVTVVGIKLSDL